MFSSSADPIENDVWLPLSLPATFHIGDSTLALRRDTTASTEGRDRWLVLGAIAAFGCILVGATLLLMRTDIDTASTAQQETINTASTMSGPVRLAEAASSESPVDAERDLSAAASSAAPLMVSEDEPTIETATLTPPAPEAEASIDEAVLVFQERLAAADLNGVIVTPGGNMIQAAGSVGTDQTSAWRDVQSWYDSTFGQRFPLVAAVTPVDAPDVPNIDVEALWLGDKPYIIAGDGRRYHIGATVFDGWVLVAIEQDQIMFERDGQTVALTL